MDIQIGNESATDSMGRRLIGYLRRPGWVFWVVALLLFVCGSTFVYECVSILHRAQKLAQVDHGINSAITELRIAHARQAMAAQAIVELASDGQQEMTPAWRTVAIDFQRHSHAFDGSIQEALARVRMEGKHESELKALEVRLCALEELQERTQNDILTIVRLTDEKRSDDIAAMYTTIETTREEIAEQLENLSSFSQIAVLNSAKQIQHSTYRVFWFGLASILLGTAVAVRWWIRFRSRVVSVSQPSLLEPETETDPSSIQAEQALAERFLLRGVHVLVAEDDIYSRRLLGRIFENAGAVVTVACDGGHALQQFRKAKSSGHPVQLVIMDLKMPVMDGLQVVSQLRDVDLFEGPVLALTAINNLDVRAECMEAGFDDYLSKPIERKRLLQLATDYIGKTVSV